MFALTFLAAPALAAESTVTVSSGDGPKMTFTVKSKSGSVKSSTKDGKSVIETKEFTIYLWSVPKAKTVAEGVAAADDVIKDEVKSMKVDETKSITIDGGDAKHLIGHGKEADDGDDGTVDVVVFTVGGKVMVACVHGEGEAAPRQREPMLDTLKTVKTE
jgi:uncharacterized protein YodC (DUF2158 family)